MNKLLSSLMKDLTGGYTPMKIVRFTLMAFAMLDASAHLYASPASYPFVTFWLEIEVSAFIIIAIVFLLGLKIWYIPAILFNAFNLVVYMISGITSLPPISGTPLVGHVQFASYSFGRAFSLIAWLYIMVVGIIMLKYDRGSKLNDLLKEDEN
ncbi:MAG: hypothetical protein M1498_02275 [Candidatus Thermoplasmatota archaeon]|nr:hypothetical protein [Candidatus Thermoplasmatota archaeon]MCL5888566.1 hypothetical protein [Candidatus Thermoplasmatota archaeon]